MTTLTAIVQHLDATFEIQRLGPDPAFSRHLPRVYDAVGMDWRGMFQPEFCTIFNGLMLRGLETVSTIYCACFPTPDVLDAVLAQAHPGDLLFLHHPLDMESGDPRGKWGRGFLPLAPAHLEALQARGISVYSCHIPLDIHAEISTTLAMAQALNPTHIERIFPQAWAHFGALCTIAEQSVDDFEAELMRTYDIPYIDFAGSREQPVRKVAVVGGIISDKTYFQQAQDMGADAWLTGDFSPRIDDERGHRTHAENAVFAETASIRLFGVSHAASEYLVMHRQLVPWLKATWPGIRAVAVPQAVWWR